jgi:hypothetical protein
MHRTLRRADALEQNVEVPPVLQKFDRVPGQGNAKRETGKRRERLLDGGRAAHAQDHVATAPDGPNDRSQQHDEP